MRGIVSEYHCQPLSIAILYLILLFSPATDQADEKKQSTSSKMTSKPSHGSRLQQQQHQQQQRQHPIPFIYRLAILYIEPFLALHAAITLLRSPESFLNAVSPNHAYYPSTSSAVLPHSSEPAFDHLAAAFDHDSTLVIPDHSGGDVLASVRILTDMLGIMQLVVAFNLAVVLRVVGPDRRLWRVICGGMLLSDLLHILATVREYGHVSAGGGDDAVLSSWRSSEWLNFGILGAMAAVRLGVVLGIGMGGRKSRSDLVAVSALCGVTTGK